MDLNLHRDYFVSSFHEIFYVFAVKSETVGQIEIFNAVQTRYNFQQIF